MHATFHSTSAPTDEFCSIDALGGNRDKVALEELGPRIAFLMCS